MAEEQILVVDDEYLIRWALQQNLRKEGYEILLAETGEEALDKVKHERPDLVLLDVRLPRMDGLKVLEKVIQVDRDLVAIMISAIEDVDTVMKATRLGPFDCEKRSFQIEERGKVQRRPFGCIAREPS